MIEYERLENLLKQIIKDMVRQEDDVIVANYLYHLGLTMKEIYYFLDEC